MTALIIKNAMVNMSDTLNTAKEIQEYFNKVMNETVPQKIHDIPLVDISLIEKFKQLQPQFTAVVSGYHLINKTPIKESVWEEINCDIVGGVCNIKDEANGNHLSGKDIRFDNVDISNKTAKKVGNMINISSYRLTSVCCDKTPGNAEDIIAEIEKRDGTFQYYSLLVRDEKKDSMISYEWYLIPKDHYLFKIDAITPKVGKIGKKKSEIVGWESKYCDITFSMSSQLWYKIDIREIEQYKLCSTEINNGNPKINYSQIFHSFSNTSNASNTNAI
jgi:hypothetical protein